MNKKIGNLPKKAKIAIVSVIVLIVTALSIVGNNIIVKQLRGNVGYNTEHLDEGTHLTEVPEGYEAIRTKEELMAIANNTENLSKKYILMSDIDLTGVSYTAIGVDYRTPFNGIFDGNNYKITNLSIGDSSKENQGLFGRVGTKGKISNLTVQGNVFGKTNVGMLVGYNEGVIDNIKISGQVNGNYRYVGGIVGYNTGTITNIYFRGTVTGPKKKDTSYTIGYVGGLVGENKRNNRAIIYNRKCKWRHRICGRISRA